MATPSSSVEKHRKALQGIILTAVYYKHNDAIHRAVEVIREQKLDEKDRQKGGKQSLDFLPSKNAQVDPEYRSHSPLMLACQRGDVDRVRLLLDEGASAAFKNKEGLNALHIACNTGSLEICRLVLEKAKEQNQFGINKHYSSDISILINAKEKRGWTPLMYAVKGDHLEILTELVETDVLDYSITNKKGANFLHIACSEGSDKILRHIIGDPPPLLPDVLKELFMATDKNGWNIIHHACSNRKSPSLTEWLLESMTVISDEDKSDLLKQKTTAGYSPMLTACEYQKVDAVHYLVGRSDVDVSDFVVESSDEGGRTGEKSALHIAAIHDSEEIAKALLDKGCKANRKDKMGNTVLHVARAKSSERVEKVILSPEHGLTYLQEERNQDGQYPRDVEPEDIIPPEILKRGSVFVERYKQALRQGKEKIPRCGLLFLGQERKGKTSLYKLIVGIKFDPQQESTCGIDNTEVDTVDSRTVTMKRSEWSETSEGDQQTERDKFHALAIISGLPEDVKRQAASQRFQEKSLNELLRRIEDIDSKINKENKPLMPKSSNVRKERDPILDSFPLSKPRQSNSPSDRQVELAPVENPPSPRPVLNSSTLILPEKIESTPKPPSKPQVPKVSPVKKAVSQPLPVSTKTVPPDQVKRRISVCSRSEVKSVNHALKNRGKKIKDPKPTLKLNVLDFAGQKNYRPMHHCFIRRRSMYIVVFNLQDMQEYLLDPNCRSNPMEEVRYWLHSIHAHISPPETEKTEDKYQRRVVLVGTHRNPGSGKEEITEDQLEKINDQVRKVLVDDDRCVNHLRKINRRYFIAVENSESDSINSGARQVRSTLDSISEKLKFLDEVYPISWLRLEGKLKEMKNDIEREKKKEKCCRMNEMIEIAERKGVPNPTDALEFFHDIGEIILLKRVSKLFLSEEDSKKIEELVISDPKMLIEIMKIIMELSKDSDNILSGKEERNLQNGMISFAVLERLCQQIPKSGIVDATTLSVILQAYCLIHPTSGNDSQADSDSASCHSDSPTNKCFVIPSMLPELQDDMIEELVQSSLPWMEFYFDFEKFLPVEVYHRLVCMLMAAAQRHPGKSRVSRFLCCFDMVYDCKWKVELEVLQHRMKISIRVSGGKKPSDCIQLIHDKYLKRICQESGFQGLKYRAGPMLPCHCSEPSVFTFVAFDDNEPKSKLPPDACPECFEEWKGSGECCSLDKFDAILQEQICSRETPSGTGGLKTVTIGELKERTKVTDFQLDGPIDQKDMLKLSNHFSNVQDYMTYLELSPSERSDVTVIRNTQSAMAEALKLWGKRNPPAATYRALVKIVLNANDGQLAIDICQHLCSLDST